jgi:hypothetical protein
MMDHSKERVKRSSEIRHQFTSMFEDASFPKSTPELPRAGCEENESSSKDPK